MVSFHEDALVQPPLAPASSFADQFVVRIDTEDAPEAGWGTGVLLGPRVVATCRHVVAVMLEDAVRVRLGTQAARGIPLSWPRGHERDHDVAFVLLDEPLGSTGQLYPALVLELDDDLVHAVATGLRGVRNALVACGHQPAGPVLTRATIDYGTRNRNERTQHVRLDESHQAGESGGPVWLVTPQALPSAAREWSPGVVLGVLAQGASTPVAGRPASMGAPKSFFVTSNALLELRDALCSSPGELSMQQRADLSALRVLHARHVEAWLPLLRGEPIARSFDWQTGQWTSVPLPTKTLHLPLGSVHLTAYTGKVLDVAISTSQSQSGGRSTNTVHMNVLLRLDDGREEHLSSSLSNIDPGRTVVSMLRAGHRVTLVWATSDRGRQALVASCYVHQIQRRFYYGARFVRGTLVGWATQLAWLAVLLGVSLYLRLVHPHSWGWSIVWWMFMVAFPLLEAWVVQRSIDSLMHEAGSDAPSA